MMRLIAGGLLLAILGSGVGLIHTRHLSRQLFIDLQTLRAQRDELEIEWEMLQLEQSTLATETVVDQAARARLDMIVPETDTVVYVIR